MTAGSINRRLQKLEGAIALGRCPTDAAFRGAVERIRRQRAGIVAAGYSVAADRALCDQRHAHLLVSSSSYRDFVGRMAARRAEIARRRNGSVS